MPDAPEAHQADGSHRRARPLLTSAGVVIEPLRVDDAEVAGAIRAIEGGRMLSLGDRCCLALTLHAAAEVLTADRGWGELDLPIRVWLVR
ncbi:MAG: hypothetical protein ACR2JO_00465 [Mycobacteriales bacterium]